MGLLQTFAPDTDAIYRGRPCRIVRAISASSVSVIFTDSGQMKVVQVSQLHDPVSEPCRLPKHPDAVSPQDMEIAEKRFQIIKPFLVGKWKYEVLNPVAEDAGVSIRTIQRWIPLWEAGKDYTTFIIRLIKSKGYEPTDGWFETRMINKVHVMTGGLTGETTGLISRVVRAAVEAGKVEIDTTFLEKVDWVKPGSRRSNARGST